jgi:hypothetical protein
MSVVTSCHRLLLMAHAASPGCIMCIRAVAAWRAWLLVNAHRLHSDQHCIPFTVRTKHSKEEQLSATVSHAVFMCWMWLSAKNLISETAVT